MPTISLILNAFLASVYKSYSYSELTRILGATIDLTEDVIFHWGLAVAVVHHDNGCDVLP